MVKLRFHNYPNYEEIVIFRGTILGHEHPFLGGELSSHTSEDVS